MKQKLVVWTRLCLSICAVLLFTACPGGGGGDGGSSNNSGGGGSGGSPQSLAQSVLTLNPEGGAAREIQFTDAGNWQENGSSAVGTYTYERFQDGRTAVLTLTQPSSSETISLLFDANTGGTFSYTAGNSGQGTFSLQQTSPPPDPEPDPDPNPDPDPGNGSAPASLSGKTMFGTRTFTSTGPVGQTHTYTFTSRSFHDSDPPEETDGNYQYTPNGSAAHLTLDYTRPKGFAGDKHEIDLQFNTSSSGTFTSVYTRADGTTIQINGVFQIE